MMKERYDALVIFSDFQDGVNQYKKNELIYSDGSRQQVNTRKKADERWENDWISAFGSGRDGGIKLYCFSTECEPQPLLSQCIKASGGETKMVTWLRTGGPAPAVPADTGTPGAAPQQTVPGGQPYRPER
jgi:hypothetical protein